MPSPTSSDLRDGNLERALALVHRAGGSVSRAELARALSVTRATAAALTEDLTTLGFVVERPARPSGRRGRPTTEIVPAARGPVALALEITVDAVRVAEVGLGGRVLDGAETLIADTAPEAVMLEVRRLLASRIERLGARCLGLGVAVYGLVAGDDRRVLLAPNLDWRDVPLGRLLQDEWGIRIVVDNDGSLAALSEVRRGRGREAETLLFVHSDIGVGGALVVDGRVQRGRAGLAGEFGHLPFGRADLECRCGARGCWETELDRRALARAAGLPADASTAGTSARAVFAAARAGDARSRRGVEDTANVLGRGLGALVNAFDPHRIVLSGHAADLHSHAPAVVKAALRGAAMLAHRHDLPPLHRTRIRHGALLGAADAIFDLAFARPRQIGAPRPSGASRSAR